MQIYKQKFPIPCLVYHVLLLDPQIFRNFLMNLLSCVRKITLKHFNRQIFKITIRFHKGLLNINHLMQAIVKESIR